MIHQMQEKIDYRCSKVNNTGIIKFWDADINCSDYKEGLEKQKEITSK